MDYNAAILGVFAEVVAGLAPVAGLLVAGGAVVAVVVMLIRRLGK